MAQPATSDAESGRAVVCLGGARTRLEPQSEPTAAAGEIVLRLRVVGFCGTDLFKLKTGSAETGAVLGHELVGEVVALGSGVDRFVLGDRVVVPHHVACGTCHLCRSGSETMCPTFKENLMAPGGFADRIAIRRRAVEQAAFRVPDHVADEAAVFVEPAACVLRGIDRSGIADRGVAAVIGCGSMGLLHLVTLRAALPGIRVVMSDPDDQRRARAIDLGAAAAVTPADAAAAVAAASDGTGADAAFDTVGGASTLNAGIDLIRPGGAVVLFAHAPADTTSAIDLNAVFKTEKRIIATYSGALDEQKRVFDLICSGALDPTPLVTHTMPLDDFARGVDLVVQQKALKVLFTPSRSAETAP